MSKRVILPYVESNTNYQVLISPLGNSKVWISDKTTGFALHYDVA